jgi:hypothetical protein
MNCTCGMDNEHNCTCTKLVLCTWEVDLNYMNVYLDGVYIIITYILVVNAIKTSLPPYC